MVPLQLLFDIPLLGLLRKFDEMLEAANDLFVDEPRGSSSQSFALRKDGLTFVVSVSDIVPSLSGYRPLFLTNDLTKAVSVISVELGANIAGGEKVPPIAKALLALGTDWSTQLSAIATLWNPAKLVSDPGFFAESVTGYTNGGAFPSLVTVDMEYSEDDGQLSSEGLSWFAGQEIALSGEGLDRRELTRRAVRIVHDLATNGPVLSDQTVPDIDNDKVVELTPNESHTFLCCKIISKTEAKSEADQARR